MHLKGRIFSNLLNCKQFNKKTSIMCRRLKGLISLAIADWIAIVIGDYFLVNQRKAVTD